MADPLQTPPGEARQGWKEIADFFGVTTRTVQLWEAERGLPVHRLPGGRVYALEVDLRAWIEAGQVRMDPPAEVPAPARSVRKRLWAAVVLTLAGSLAVWFAWPTPRPAAASVKDRVVTVVDAKGLELWKAVLPGEPVKAEPDAGMTPAIQALDIDGDGPAEVLATLHPGSGQGSDELVCYSSSGQIRWVWKAGGTVRTRKGELMSAFVLNHVSVWESGAGRGILVTAVSQLSFASQVALLGSDGQLRRQYWHAGHLRFPLVVDSDHDGRPELWLGGVHNPSGRATLVILDPDEMQGASREESPAYQLVAAEAPREVARVLLYRSEASRKLSPFSGSGALSTQGEAVAVATREIHPGPGRSFPSILYEFQGPGRLKSAAFVDNSLQVYAQLVGQGLIDAGMYERDKQRLTELTWLKPWGR